MLNGNRNTYPRGHGGAHHLLWRHSSPVRRLTRYVLLLLLLVVVLVLLVAVVMSLLVVVVLLLLLVVDRSWTLKFTNAVITCFT